MAKEQKPKRLCAEIQLFDLCDKERCNHKEGRYCTDEAAVTKFEALLDKEDSPDQFLTDELDETEGDDLAFDEDYAEDEYYEDEDQELNEEEDF